MGIGAGLIEGEATDSLLDATLDGEHYVSNSGAVFHPQDESGTGNVAFWEITSESDSITFQVPLADLDFDTPVLVLRTLFGPTDFDVQESGSGSTIVSEQSGFDTDIWFVNIAGTPGEYTLTDFDTGDGVNGTQAGWYPFIVVEDLQTW